METRILGYKCRTCGHVHYPNKALCMKCGAGDFDTEPLPFNGTLLTYTELYNPPGDFDVVKLPLGIVELENGVRMMGQLEIDHPAIGMAVKGRVDVVRRTKYDKIKGMIFKAA